MPGFRLALYDLRLPTKGSLQLPADAYRFLYVRDGVVDIENDDGTQRLMSDAGAFTHGAASLAGAGVVWMFELASDPPVFAIGDAISLVRSHWLAPDAASGTRILRADRIESPAGSVTPLHRHQGPGIRRLIYGRLMAQVGAQTELVTDGLSWFESGRDPVVGSNINTANNAFVRVMVLPAALRGGKTSFIPETPEDALKPRILEQSVFGEMRLELDL